MKKQFLNITLIMSIIFIIFLSIYFITCNKVIYSLTITFGTIAFHFVMRLFVGLIINYKYHNEMNYKRKWFRVSNLEIKFYEFIKVKKWKKFVPTFSPDSFKLTKDNIGQIIKTTCQSEIVHEIIMILSFVPLLFSIWFDDFFVFFITSFIAFLLDSIFVILQRYNRPRLLKIIKKN